MPTALVNDIKMYYEIRGSGSPLLMIMGWTANKDWWPEDFLCYLEKYYTLILFDNRGAGRTDSPRGLYYIAQLADDVMALMNVLNIQKAHVFGVSMGGMIAQELTIRYPDRVEQLILGCTTCGPKRGQALSFIGVYYGVSYGFRYGYNLDKWLIRLVLSRSELNDKDQEFIRRIRIAPIKRLDKWKQFWAVRKFDSYSRLEKIKCPVLVMTGTKDLLMPQKNSDILVEKIPDAKLIKMHGLSHAFIGDDPDGVFIAIHNFLKSN
jgi:pimeloyl-ACP methyl ester carboxylesterase